jgi:hypothetical protein
VLPDEGGVVAGLDVADVVDDREQRVLVLTHRKSVLCKNPAVKKSSGLGPTLKFWINFHPKSTNMDLPQNCGLGF